MGQWTLHKIGCNYKPEQSETYILQIDIESDEFIKEKTITLI